MQYTLRKGYSSQRARAMKEVAVGSPVHLAADSAWHPEYCIFVLNDVGNASQRAMENGPEWIRHGIGFQGLI